MRKVMLAAAAVGTLVAPTAAMASSAHQAPQKGKTVHVCVSQKKHGLKVRVSRKCTHGEKGLTLHLPAGPQGPQGPAGPQGAAGNGLSVKDAHGNVIGTPVAYYGNDIWVMLADGTIQDVNATTGQINYETPDLEYASADCTGPAYISTDWSPSAQTPFAAPNQSAVASPLYTASTSPVPLNVGSTYDAFSGCTPGSSFDATAHAINATGGTVQANLAGPLTITK
jgi:hypothetical protein